MPMFKRVDSAKMSIDEFISQLNFFNEQPKNNLFSKIWHQLGILNEELNLFDSLQSHIREFWTKSSKLEFLNCTVDSFNAKRSATDFIEVVKIYSQATFFSEELEEELSLMENLVRASQINVGIVKANFVVYERICRELSGRVELRNTILIERMAKKLKICDKIQFLERKLNSSNLHNGVNQKVSFSKLKEAYDEYKEFCDETEVLKDSD